MTRHFLHKRNFGYSMIELVFYVALFAVLSMSVINAMIVMTKSFKEATIQTELASGADMLERISREVRQAYNIVSISSSDLKLDTKDDAGLDKTVRFLLASGNLEFYENDVLTGNLNMPVVNVSSLSFTQITTDQARAVRIALSVQSDNDLAARTIDFYNTVVLRGEY